MTWRLFRRELEPNNVGLLIDQLTKAHQRELQLLALIKAKDEQIQMVLEDKFFHPVVNQPKPPEVDVSVDVRDMTDVTQFPAEGDVEELKKQDEAARHSREELAKALNDGDTETIAEAVEAGQGAEVEAALTEAVAEIAEEHEMSRAERHAKAVEELEKA